MKRLTIWALFGFALVSGSTAGAMEGARAALSGSVRDTLGRVVAGVEVLLVDPGATAIPAAAARTDGAGRFAVLRLQPGVYQIAAVKGGYDTFVGQVDTLLRNSVDLVLHPSIAVDRETLPADPSWALRIPRRGVLREVDALPESPLPADAVRGGADPLRVQLEQVVSLGADLSESRTGTMDVEAGETRMKLAAQLGPQVTLAVQGRHERLGTAPSSADTDRASANQSDRAVGIGLSYEMSGGSRLGVNARLTDNEYHLAAASQVSRFDQEQRIWGYDASWIKDLAADQRLTLAVDYEQTILGGTTSHLGSTPAVDVAAQTVGAQGSYRYAGAEDHDVSVQLRTEVWPRGWNSEVGTSQDSVAGLSLQADDRWSVAGPLSLNYGLGVEYRDADAERQVRVVSPRVGAGFEVAGWAVRGLVSYQAVSEAPRGPGDTAAALIRSEGPLGYEARIEIPIASHLKIQGSGRRAPLETALVGYQSGVERFGAHPIYITAGDVAVSEYRLALVEELGTLRAYLEWTEGSVEGTVSPVMRYAGTEALAQRDLDYRSARMGVFAPSLGTDVTLEYQRLNAGPRPGARPTDAAREESLEVRVAKNLSTSRRMGYWRMLLALHVSSIQTEEIDAWRPYGANDAINALNRRLSGGVSVLF